MAIAPYENLKGFAASKPPVVVFMVCLGSFAVVLLSLAYYVKLSELENPDISQDWNKFLDNFSGLEFCVTGNDSSHAASTNPPASTKVTTANPEPHILEFEGPRNYSISMVVSVDPTVEFLKIPHNVTHLKSTLYGEILGLKGPAAEELVNITVELPYDWNSTKCVKNGQCQQVQILTCVTFHGSPNVFPTTMNPQTCNVINGSGVEYHARMVGHKQKSFFSRRWCRSMPTVKVKHHFDPTMTVMLSINDRSVINLHLMHTSYFLFVMVVTLFCYAIIRGRPLKAKVISVPEKLLNHV